MKIKLFLLLWLAAPIISNAQPISDTCIAGTIDSAWILNQTFRPLQAEVLIKYPTTPVLTKAYDLRYVYDAKMGVGIITKAWQLRSDEYGPSALSVIANFPSLRLEKAYQISKNQKVCAHLVGNAYAIEFPGDQYP